MVSATLAGVRKGHRELEAALAQAVAVFGEPINLSCNASNGRTFSEFEAYAEADVWAKHATRAFVNVESLLEYGRPKAINEGWWTWKSDFVKVHLSTEYPYNIYWHEPGTVDESGKHTKARLRPFNMVVRVSGGRNYGLGTWQEHRVALAGWAATFANDAARAALLAGVAEADRNVAEWKDGIAAMTARAVAL